MFFAAPIWLLLLLPFVAFALWLCFGRRKRTPVPFLQLWDAPEELRRPKKGLEIPPIAIILALLALLVGLLAMARPQQRRERATVAVIVDRGATMSAVIEGMPRFVRATEMLVPMARDMATFEFVDVIDPRLTANSRYEVAKWTRTALDTSGRIAAAVRIARDRGLPVIVLTDHPPPADVDRVIHLAPEGAVTNAGITHVAFNKSQVMVGVRANFKGQRTIQVLADRKTIDLAPGEERRLFWDVTNPPDVIEARLAEPDDFDGDDRAWLARRASWPIVEPRIPISEEVRRVLEAYARHRPASQSSPIVTLSRDPDAAIILPQLAAEAPLAKLDVKAHPLSDGVDWSALASAAVAEKPPGEGWTTIVSAAGRPLVAVRESDRRQVWIGFWSRAAAQTAGFVSLWTNALDWVGRGGEDYSYAAITPDIAAAKRLAPQTLPDGVEPNLWPGVFEGDGVKFAANAAFIEPKTQPANWRERFAALNLSARGTIDLSPWFALAALALILCSAITWPFPRRIVRVDNDPDAASIQAKPDRHEAHISRGTNS